MSHYNEDTFVQQATAHYLEQQLGWGRLHDLRSHRHARSRLMNGEIAA